MNGRGHREVPFQKYGSMQNSVIEGWYTAISVLLVWTQAWKRSAEMHTSMLCSVLERRLWVRAAARRLPRLDAVLRPAKAFHLRGRGQGKRHALGMRMQQRLALLRPLGHSGTRMTP